MSILFEPCVIGSVRLRNRIIYSAMDLRSGDGDGLFNDRSRESAVERARGGAALVYAPGVECRIYREIAARRFVWKTTRPFRGCAVLWKK